MMAVKYYTYNVAQVRAWLYDGENNGLSEDIISKIRANSLIHNPYVQDEMTIVVAAKDEDRVVGFTTMFPEKLQVPQVTLSVPSTLYANPQYADEYIGYNVTKLLHDTADGRFVIGTDMAKEAAMIDNLLGLEIENYERVRFIMNRNIKVKSLRNFGSLILEPFRLMRQKQSINRLVSGISDLYEYQITNVIDNEIYTFISEHSCNDIFLRSQETLNWLIRYPFSVDTSIDDNLIEKNIFQSHIKDLRVNIVKIYFEGKLVGLYAIRMRNKNADILMLYSNSQHDSMIYSILLKHIIKLKPAQLNSVYKALNEFIYAKRIFLKSYIESFVFTFPKVLNLDMSKQLQGMDGDMFA